MRLLMKKHNVERIADTEEAKKRLESLGYVAKKDLEKKEAAKEKDTDIEAEKCSGETPEVEQVVKKKAAKKAVAKTGEE